MAASATICPACSSTDTQFLPKRNEWICQDCTHRWQKSAADVSEPPPAAAVSLKIFLSYGRRDAAPLAERIAGDLKGLGHDVWVDKREIQPGTSWQHEIVDGLRSSHVVIALMSPHSVRNRAQDSSDGVDNVCLGEIAYTLFSPPPRPVVPVMAVPCEPPLAIYHLDYVEMTRWSDSESQYRMGLERLLKFLDDTHLRKEPHYRSWYHHLKPWDFAAFLHDKRKNFTGRKFLVCGCEPGHSMKRMEYCWRKYYHHWNCHARALLAEGFFFIVGEQDHGKSGWQTGRARTYLMNLTQAIDCWLRDSDVWVLEHVYQAFRIIVEQQKADDQLRTWAQERLAHVDAQPDCLLSLVSQFTAKPWFELERGEFLEQLQVLKRLHPFQRVV